MNRRLSYFFLLSLCLHIAILFLPNILASFHASEIQEANISARETLISLEMPEENKIFNPSLAKKLITPLNEASEKNSKTNNTGASSDATPDGEIKPEYPLASKKLGEEGSVELLLSIDEAGNVQNIAIERSSGFSRLDQAAMKSAKSAHFRPARKAGQAMKCEKRIRLKFQLQ